MEKQDVLFLCTGNSARSQMAEAFLRHHAGDRFHAFSAGLNPKGINPYTVAVMREVGLDLEGHYSKSVREYLGHKSFRHTIIVCQKADEDCPTIFPDSYSRMRWNFPDPAKATGSDDAMLAIFRQVRDRIEARVKLFIEETMD